MRSTSLLFAAAASLALGAAAGGNAVAQSWPSKPIAVISAFPPANNDQIIRMVDGAFQAAFKQPLVIESRPGAGGNIGAEAVARAAPDGHTLLVTVDTVATVNPRLYSNLRFKADVDLVPVIYLANSAQTLVCHPSVPVKSIADLLAHARTHDLSYASGGQGVPGHLAAEMFLAATGVRMTHIPYKGPAAAAQDLVGGNVHCGFLATPTAMPHVKSGRLTGLAVTSAQRSLVAMDLPTISEAGVAGFEASFGQLLLAPKGTPPAIVAALNQIFSAALAQPDVRARMLAMDLEFVPNTPEQAAARVRREADKWARVVERLGLRAD
jgi:tripartite-type tricarboxylate transporter receptor subunit TctC